MTAHVSPVKGAEWHHMHDPTSLPYGCMNAEPRCPLNPKISSASLVVWNHKQREGGTGVLGSFCFWLATDLHPEDGDCGGQRCQLLRSACSMKETLLAPQFVQMYFSLEFSGVWTFAPGSPNVTALRVHE
eukprot:216559-Amphidinium_carterae.2